MWKIEKSTSEYSILFLYYLYINRRLIMMKMSKEGYLSIVVKSSTKRRLNEIKEELRKRRMRNSYNDAIEFLLDFYEEVKGK